MSNVITNDEELEARVKELERIEDFEEQGYQSGPIVAYITKAPVRAILSSISADPFRDEINVTRDKGLARWCREQLRKGDGIDHSWCDGVEGL